MRFERIVSHSQGMEEKNSSAIRQGACPTQLNEAPSDPDLHRSFHPQIHDPSSLRDPDGRLNWPPHALTPKPGHATPIGVNLMRSLRSGYIYRALASTPGPLGG